MNKIYIYILGVMSSLNGLACCAAEKFDIIPDLPESLENLTTYAGQPAQAATISNTTDTALSTATQSVGSEPNILSAFLTLIFVILLIYCTGIVFTKLNKFGFKTMRRQQGEFAKSQVSVVSTTSLGNNKSLHVVELDGKRMLIGASSGAIQLIKDLGSTNVNDEEEFSHIEIPNIKIPKIEIPKIEIPSIGFSKLVTKAHKSMESVENETNVEESEIQDESIVENTNETLAEENPDVIIDSLFSQPESQIPTEPEIEPVKSEHVVDPDEFVLYKKYLG